MSRSVPQLRALFGGALVASLALPLALVACSGGDGGGEAPVAEGKAGKGKAKGGKGKAAAEPAKGPEPRQDALEGDPTEALILAQAWFWKDENNKPKPGPARLQIWRKGEAGWKATLLEDGESNVFHKVVLQDDGTLITIGAEGAKLKTWKHADGKWTSETLYENTWGGKFNRLRDFEMGDVDGDGKDEWVIATHDFGVITVYEPDTKEHVELDKKADTFVHEIEIGDIDGDGKKEFFATPSDRNQANKSQHGEIVMYKHDGSTYVRSVVDPGEDTHAKEILIADIEGDGTDEFFGVMEAQTDDKKQVIKPVTIRQYTPKVNEDGTPAEGFDIAEIASIEDRQTRFLLASDFDGDGEQELVAAAMKTGIYYLDSAVDEASGARTWTAQRFETDSSGFEHATIARDLDGDGTLELYVAADDQRELRKYTWDAENKTFNRELLGRLQDSTITWNIEAGKL